VVGLPILFTDKTFVLDFTSIATLFAFVLVCGGVLLIPRKERIAGKFHLPYINSRYLFPILVLITAILIFSLNPNYLKDLLTFDYSSNEAYTQGHITFMDAATPAISLLIFWISSLILAINAFRKNYSLIPLLGLVTCMYLLTGMTKSNWIWFIGWMLIGLVVYFLYGYKKSKLSVSNSSL
jgi:hypothetical protein